MGMLKYAILGMVGRKPMTGYDIKKQFEEAVSKFWTAKHSQIYPELNEMLEDGLVDYSVAIHGAKLEKKYYSITPAGRKELNDWLDTILPIESVQKESFRLKLYFGDYYTGAEELQPIFQDQYRQHAQRLQIHREKLSETIPARGTQEFGEYLLTREEILLEEAYLNWMQECALLRS